MVVELVRDDKDYINRLESTIELFQERMTELELSQEDMGWVRLGGESSYEFSLHYLRQIVARSRLFFLQNPLINRAVSIQADYIFAQGVSIQASNDLVNEVIQEFIDDVRNNLS